jgi:hypothetical protein
MQTSIARDVIQSHKILWSVVLLDDSRLASSVIISTIYLHQRLVNSSSNQVVEFYSVVLCWEPIIDANVSACMVLVVKFLEGADCTTRVMNHEIIYIYIQTTHIHNTSITQLFIFIYKQLISTTHL